MKIDKATTQIIIIYFTVFNQILFLAKSSEGKKPVINFWGKTLMCFK